MKIARSYTLDLEIIERLKELNINASELINSLLIDYLEKNGSKFKKENFQSENPDTLTPEQKQFETEEDKKQFLKEDRRNKERKRAIEFEMFVNKNNLKITKLQFMELMHEYSSGHYPNLEAFTIRHASLSVD